MSGSTAPQIAIGITGDDSGFNKTIARVNKQLQALTQQGSGLGQSTGKLASANQGINRLSQGMHTFGIETESAAGAMAKLIPAVGTLTSAGTLGGIAALVRSFASAGVQLSNLSYSLSLPPGELLGVEHAAARVGVAAGTATDGLKTLQQNMMDAVYGHGEHGAMIQNMLNRLNINPGSKEHLRDVSEVYGELLDKIKTFTPQQQRLWLQSLAGHEDLLPMVAGGSKAIADAQGELKKLGDIPTDKYLQDTKEFQKAWVDLGAVADAVGMSITERLIGPMTKYMVVAKQVYEQNKQILNDAAFSASLVGGVAAGYGMFKGLVKSSAWLVEKLGMRGASKLILAAGGLGEAALATELIYEGTRIKSTVSGVGDEGPQRLEDERLALQQRQEDQRQNELTQSLLATRLLGKDWGRFGSPGYGGFGAPFGGEGKTPVPPRKGTPQWDVMMRGRAFWKNKGFDDDQVAGILTGGEAAESSFNPAAIGPGGSVGLYQELGDDRLGDMRRKYGWFPSEQQQREHMAWWIGPTGPAAAFGRQLHATHGSGNVARLWTTDNERPKHRFIQGEIRAAGAPAFEHLDEGPTNIAPTPRPDGYRPGVGPRASVDLKVTIHSDHPTRAQVDARGDVNVSRPVIELPLYPH